MFFALGVRLQDGVRAGPCSTLLCRSQQERKICLRPLQWIRHQWTEAHQPLLVSFYRLIFIYGDEFLKIYRTSHQFYVLQMDKIAGKYFWTLFDHHHTSVPFLLCFHYLVSWITIRNSGSATSRSRPRRSSRRSTRAWFASRTSSTRGWGISTCAYARRTTFGLDRSWRLRYEKLANFEPIASFPPEC